MAKAISKRGEEILRGLLPPMEPSVSIPGEIIYFGTNAAAEVWARENFEVFVTPDGKKTFIPFSKHEALPRVPFHITIASDPDHRDVELLGRMRVDLRYWIVEGDISLDWHHPFVQHRCLPFIKTLAVAAVMERNYYEAQKFVRTEIMRLATVGCLEASFVTNREEIYQVWCWAYAHAHTMTRPEFFHIPPPFEWSSPLMVASKPRMAKPLKLRMGNSYDVRAFFASVGHPADMIVPPSGPLVDLDGDVADAGPGPTERSTYDALKAHLAEIDKLFDIAPGESRIARLREIKRLAAIGRQFQDNLEDIEALREELEQKVCPDVPDTDTGRYTHTFRPGDGPFVTLTTEHADGTEATWDASSVLEPIDVTTIGDVASGRRTFVSPDTGITRKIKFTDIKP